MALALTAKLQERAGTGSTAYGTGSYTTASFTPANNSLLVVAVMVEEDNFQTPTIADNITISGGGLTWTSRVQAQGAVSGTWAAGLRVFTAHVTVGASMTVTVDCGGLSAWSYEVQIFEFTGHNPGSPVGGTASFYSGTGGNSGAETLTLSSAPVSASYVLGFAYNDVTSDSGVTTGTGWTQQYRSYEQYYTAHSQSRTGSTSESVTWNDLTSGYLSAAVALEIKAEPTYFGGTPGTQANNDSGYTAWGTYTCPGSGSQAVTVCGAYGHAISTTPVNLRIAIYDSAGTTLIAQSAAFTGVHNGGVNIWQYAPISATLTGGASYKLALSIGSAGWSCEAMTSSITDGNYEPVDYTSGGFPASLPTPDNQYYMYPLRIGVDAADANTTTRKLMVLLGVG
jgi:hypothetical protein